MSRLNKSYLQQLAEQRRANKSKFQVGGNDDKPSYLKPASSFIKKIDAPVYTKPAVNRSTQDNLRTEFYKKPQADLAQIQKAKEAQAEAERRKISGVIRETTDEDREAQNRQDLTFAGRARAKGTYTPFADLLDVFNPAAYYYGAKDAAKGIGQTAEGIYNLDAGQIGSGLLQTGLGALSALPAAGTKSLAKPLSKFARVTPGQYRAIQSFVNAPLSSTGKYLTTQTPLKNTWQYNPWRFKENPEAYYHRSPNLKNIINQEQGILQGFGNSAEGQAYSELARPGMGNTILSDGRVSTLNLRKPANNQLYFSKGVPLDYGRYNPETFNSAGKRIMTGQGYPGPYLVEVEGVPMGRSTKGRKPSLDPPSNLEGYAVSHRPINLDEAKFYKEDWLRGYKEVPKPKQPFKSEIDWAKWNPETPKHKVLMDEYNAIEESTKKAGTWMKNPDGSAFQGTPEQFVQQQSSWFKKAFPNPIKDQAGNIQFTYHGSPNTFNTFDKNIMLTGRTKGEGIYTSPYKERAASYANSGDKKVYQLYQNSNKLQNELADFNKASDERFAEFLKNNPKKAPDFEKKFKEFMDNEEKLYDKNFTVEDFKLKPGYDLYKASSDEYVVPFTNYPKSAVGNVGFFDMTNPNIYKGLIPAGLGLGAIQQYLQNKPKGTYQMGGMSIPGVNGSVVSSYQATQYNKYKSKKK